MRNAFSLPVLLLSFFGTLLAGCSPGSSGSDAGSGQDTTAAASTQADSMIVEGGFQGPESMLYDAEEDVYLVSNLNGPPAEKDDNGFISRVSPEGEVLALQWIDGAASEVTLHAPKGMGVRGDTLFVTDIDEVRLFHRTTGAPLGSWPVQGASFLNDLAVGSDGAVYVTDTGIRFTNGQREQGGTDAVYRIGGAGTVTPLVRDTRLNNPNGVAVTPEGLVVVSLGGTDVFGVDGSGGMSTLSQVPQAGLDGVVRLPDGSFVVSSWQGRAVYLVPASGEVTTVAQGVNSPADIDVDSKRHRVLIPQLQENQLYIVSLDGMHH